MNNLTEDSHKCYEFINDNIIYTSPDTHFSGVIDLYSDKISTTTDFKFELKTTATIHSSIVKEALFTIVNIINSLDEDELDSIGIPKLKDNDELIEWLIRNHMNLKPLVSLNKNSIREGEHLSKLNRLLYDNPFVPIAIQHYSETHDLNYMYIVYGNLNIHVYQIPGKVPEIDINRVIRICEFMRNIANSKRGFELVLFFSPLRKKLERGEKLYSLLPLHINSGSTLSGIYINIWRYEEWEKVLIHELVHMLQFDSISTLGQIGKRLKESYCIDGSIRVNEAYTECIAIIFHSIYVFFKSL